MRKIRTILCIISNILLIFLIIFNPLIWAFGMLFLMAFFVDGLFKLAGWGRPSIWWGLIRHD